MSSDKQIKPEISISRMFEEVTGLYDFFNDLFSLFLVRHWRRTVSRLFIRKSSRVLDLGIGTGYLSQNVHEDSGSMTVGLDITRSMILKRRDAIMSFSDPVIGTAAQMPFRDGSFDFIVSSFTIRSLKLAGLDSVLSECRRVLKSSGEAVFLDTARPRGTLSLAFFKVYFKIIKALGALYRKSGYSWLTRSIMDLDPDYVRMKIYKHFSNVSEYVLTGSIAYIWRSYKSAQAKSE
ncbi:MAG: class I SAM-dependent methyltransferase [Nitrososphaeria archaeon]